MTNNIYLIGGGWNESTFAETYGRFVEDAKRRTGPIAIVVAEEDEQAARQAYERFRQAFLELGLAASDLTQFTVSAQRPLLAAQLAGTAPCGVFVCGGLTPWYQQALCIDQGWLAYVREHGIPYAGFSAGAAIAAPRAIVGGWKIKVPQHEVEILGPDFAEDLEMLTVEKGLGLVPFAIDVHASQWGTVTRLLHAIDQGLADTGWAIDENTMLEICHATLSIHGKGNAYHVWRDAMGSMQFKIHRAGTRIAIDPQQ